MKLFSQVGQEIALDKVLGDLLAWQAGRITEEELQDAVMRFIREKAVVATHERLQDATSDDDYREVAQVLLSDYLADLRRDEQAQRERIHQQFRVSADQPTPEAAALEVQFEHAEPPVEAKPKKARPWMDPIIIYDRMDGLVQTLTFGFLTIPSLITVSSICVLGALIVNSALDADGEGDVAVQGPVIPQSPAASPAIASSPVAKGDPNQIPETGESEVASLESESKPADSALIELKKPEDPKSNIFSFSEADPEAEKNGTATPRTKMLDFASSNDSQDGPKLLKLSSKQESPDLDSVLAGALGETPEEFGNTQGRSKEDIGLQGILTLLDDGEMEAALEALTRKSAAFSERNIWLIKLEILAGGDSKARQECWELLLRSSETGAVSDMLAARLLLTSNKAEKTAMWRKLQDIPGAPERYATWARSWMKDKSALQAQLAQDELHAQSESEFLDEIFLANAYFVDGQSSKAHEALNKAKARLNLFICSDRTPPVLFVAFFQKPRCNPDSC